MGSLINSGVIFHVTINACHSSFVILVMPLIFFSDLFSFFSCFFTFFKVDPPKLRNFVYLIWTKKSFCFFFNSFFSVFSCTQPAYKLFLHFVLLESVKNHFYFS